MDKCFIDTNLFLRFLTNDVSAQADAVARLLRQAAEGKVALQTSALVVAEIVWTLESYYELDRRDVKVSVLAILNTPGLWVEDAPLIAEAIMLYADTSMDFIDAYNAFWMKKHGLSGMYTFDKKHFAQAEGIVPLVPGKERAD